MNPLKADKVKKDTVEGDRTADSPGTAEDASREAANREPESAKVTVEQAGGSRGVGEDPTLAFLAEATGLLKSLRAMKALRYKTANAPESGVVAGDEGLSLLLDGGATHALLETEPPLIPSISASPLQRRQRQRLLSDPY